MNPADNMNLSFSADPVFNAEQAVKKRLGDKHVDWWYVQRGEAVQRPYGTEVLDAYRDALIEAHTLLIDHVNAITDKYNRDWEFTERRRHEEREQMFRAIDERREWLDKEHGRALDALQPVFLARQAKRKTVRVADIIAILDQTK